MTNASLDGDFEESKSTLSAGAGGGGSSMSAFEKILNKDNKKLNRL